MNLGVHFTRVYYRSHRISTFLPLQPMYPAACITRNKHSNSSSTNDIVRVPCQERSPWAGAVLCATPATSWPPPALPERDGPPGRPGVACWRHTTHETRNTKHDVRHGVGKHGRRGKWASSPHSRYENASMPTNPAQRSARGCPSDAAFRAGSTLFDTTDTAHASTNAQRHPLSLRRNRELLHLCRSTR